MRYDRESTTGVPRWVKLVGVILAVVVLLLVVMLLIGGGGGHGPGRHMPGQHQEQETGPGDGGAHDPSQWSHG